MEFNKEDLLDYSEMKKMMASIFTNDKANMLQKKLSKQLFINTRDNFLYILQKNITYHRCENNSDDMMLKCISLLLEKSFLALKSDDRDDLKETFKGYKTIFKNSNIKEYLPQLRIDLSKDIVFDSYKDEIHFNNGYMNLKTQKFQPRTRGHFITEYIRYDYKPSNEEYRKKLLKIIKKIYPNKNDRKAMIMQFAICITGHATDKQSTLFLLGEGSSGKSTIMELNLAALECYVHELKDDTFSQSSKDICKVLNEYKNKPFIRISWLNEPKDEKFNSTMFKNYADGKIKTTELYKDGQLIIEIFCKAVVSANTNPNLIMDTGVTRRIEAFTHKSKFVDNEKDVDEEKNIYLKDEKLKEKLQKDINLKCAWFDILLDYCQLYYKGEKIQETQNFIDSREIIISSNDHIKDFVDAKLQITNNPNDRIGKNAMHKKFSETYPNKHLTTQQLITSLKERKIEYDRQLRSDYIQGSFIGVKFKNNIVDEDYDITPEQQLKNLQNQIYALQQHEIMLKQMIQENSKIIKNQYFGKKEEFVEDEEDEKPKKKVTKPKVQKEEEYYDDADDEKPKKKDDDSKYLHQINIFDL
jgi:hypothetical protein